MQLTDVGLHEGNIELMEMKHPVLKHAHPETETHSHAEIKRLNHTDLQLRTLSLCVSRFITSFTVMIPPSHMHTL